VAILKQKSFSFAIAWLSWKWNSIWPVGTGINQEADRGIP
jgi:hypothetical protein